MTKVLAQRAYYIKLGARGDWEEESLREGLLRLGYDEAPHEACTSGDWRVVWTAMRAIRANDGSATNDTTQIRAFYEADNETVFVTLANGLLHWCKAAPGVQLHPSGQGRIRRTISGWHSKSAGGKSLTTDRLSGNLLKVQSFRGTICQVHALDYLLRKINDERLPEVAAAEDAEALLLSAIVGLMRLLTWQDFELLVDLVFSTSGWRRVSVLGRTQKTVDLELLLPTTGERAFVQVKSTARESDVSEYVERFTSSPAYNRMFFVWHTGMLGLDGHPPGVSLVGPDQLARMVIDAGLASWLREKVS